MRWIAGHQTERANLEECDFEVVGELKANPGYLLLRGCDGHCYAMDATTGQLEPLEPDDAWAIDVTPQASMRIAPPADALS